MKHGAVTGMVLAALVLTVAVTLWAQDPMASTLSSTSSTVEASRRKLWRSNIQTPQDDGDSKELQEAIARLQKSMHLPKPPASSPPPVVRRATTRPATTQPSEKNPTTMPATTQPATMTAERIRKLNSIEDPAALADALFQAKHPDLAVVFYDRAFKGPAAPKTKA